MPQRWDLGTLCKYRRLLMCKCVCVCQRKRVINRRGRTCQEQLFEKIPFSFPFILTSFSIWHSPYNYSLAFHSKDNRQAFRTSYSVFHTLFFFFKAPNHSIFVSNKKQTISSFPHSKHPTDCRLNGILCCVSQNSTTRYC